MQSTFLIVLIIAFVQSIQCLNKLKLVKEWKELDLSFPDKSAKFDAINRKFYVKGASVPIDMDVFYEHGGNSRIFVTIPRFDTGRPFTLATISSQPDPEGNTLKPYPDYSWHNNQGANCDGLTSVYRIAIDECSRLWVLDTGSLGDERVCHPQLLVFDLRTDTMIHRHRINPTSLAATSLLVNPIVDVRDPKGGCYDTFVYIADITTYNMIVYDYTKDKSWRVDNKLFYPYPSEGTFYIEGESFDLMDGLLGMALSPNRGSDHDRTLYFHALASVTENFVQTSVLRNATAWETLSVNPRKFQVFDKKRSSQSATEAMDRNGVMFFGLATPTAIGCWNSAKEYSPANIDIVSYDPEKLQFLSGVKIINNLKGEQELWVLSCRFQKVMTGTMTPTEVNFRIQAGKIDHLLKNTKCASPNGHQHSNSVKPNQPGFSSYGGAKSP